jgi:iron complex transport system substrate-binding protein
MKDRAGRRHDHVVTHHTRGAIDDQREAGLLQGGKEQGHRRVGRCVGTRPATRARQDEPCRVIGRRDADYLDPAIGGPGEQVASGIVSQRFFEVGDLHNFAHNWGEYAVAWGRSTYSPSVRIVSLLPSATEILFAIGAGDDVVGVTFECDFPDLARQRQIVSTSALPEGLSSAEIDAYVSRALARGEDLYHLDRNALAEISPDVIVTQDLCAVCAVDVSVVDDALKYLGCGAKVVTLDPHSLEEVMSSIRTLGEVTGRTVEAESLILDQRMRMLGVMRSVALRRQPRVAVLEWTDPPFAPGHWVPEMVELAGGICVLGKAGEKSVRITWEDVRAATPDVLIAAPCGYDLAGAQVLAEQIVASGELPGVPTYAVDANASWARPGTRLLDGVEELAAILHFHARRPVAG